MNAMRVHSLPSMRLLMKNIDSTGHRVGNAKYMQHAPPMYSQTATHPTVFPPTPFLLRLTTRILS